MYKNTLRARCGNLFFLTKNHHCVTTQCGCCMTKAYPGYFPVKNIEQVNRVIGEW